jgi:hypothetical protein
MKSKIIFISILVLFGLGVLWLISHAYVVVPLLLGVRILAIAIILGVVAYYIGRFRRSRNL